MGNPPTIPPYISSVKKHLFMLNDGIEKLTVKYITELSKLKHLDLCMDIFELEYRKVELNPKI